MMTDLAKLERGKRYRVARIDEDAYVVVEGFENSKSGGLYWTEFVAATQPKNSFNPSGIGTDGPHARGLPPLFSARSSERLNKLTMGSRYLAGR